MCVTTVNASLCWFSGVWMGLVYLRRLWRWLWWTAGGARGESGVTAQGHVVPASTYGTGHVLNPGE